MKCTVLSRTICNLVTFGRKHYHSLPKKYYYALIPQYDFAMMLTPYCVRDEQLMSSRCNPPGSGNGGRRCCSQRRRVTRLLNDPTCFNAGSNIRVHTAWRGKEAATMSCGFFYCNVRKNHTTIRDLTTSSTSGKSQLSRPRCAYPM